MLQFDVPELVEGASLAENATLVRVVEECHQPERQVATQCQPAAGDEPLGPGSGLLT
jgi:hypothetical protein